MGEKNMQIVLTVADHEKQGFVSLAKWTGLAEKDARGIVASFDAQISDEEEPDIKTAPFTFILDIWDGPHDLIDSGERMLPLQTAMRLAPDQVSEWLKARPEPDDVAFTEPPVLPPISPGPDKGREGP